MAKRTRRPEDETVDFHESLAPAMAPASVGTPSIPPRVMQIAMYGLWILVAVTAGVGLGLWIVSRNTARSALPGIPVATAAVTIVHAPSGNIGLATVTVPVLAMASSSAVEQSSVGDIWQVAPLSALQPADQPEALQPGFTAYGLDQGTVGTAPVVKR
jgi:hypothetical protein